MIALAVATTLLPIGFDEAAACSPRLFRELGPAPGQVSSTPAETASADVADPAAAETPPQPVAPPPPRCSFYYNMDHPIAGRSATLSVFGAIREGGERWHAGLDIAAAKLTPVVAVRSGTVLEVNRNGQGDCCWVKIQHNDGWQSLYVHLNNDVAGTDDGDGVGIVRRLEVGDPVRRGQVIGYVGDSGNAEPGVAHLHFELRTPWGESVDPLPSVRRAARRGVSAFANMTEPPAGFSGPFADLDEVSFDMVALGVSLGMPLACDDFGLFFCGDSEADVESLRAWAEALTTDRLDPTTWGPEAEAVGQAEQPREFVNGVRAPDFDLGATTSDQTTPTTSEWDLREIERFLQLCTVACPDSIDRQDVVEHLHSIDVAPAGPVYLETDANNCSTPPADEAITRLQLLEMLMRALAVLPPLVEPPCDRLS